MKNFLRSAEKLIYVNSGAAISAGDLIDLGAIVGIAINDIAATTGTGPVAITGVFTLAKESSVAHAVGDRVYWNGTACTKTVAAYQYVGIVTEAAGSSATTVEVAINVGQAAILDSTAVNFSKIFATVDTAVSGDDTAGYIDIDTGFGVAPSGFIVQILRSGVPISSDQIITALSGASAGMIRVADGGATYAVTAGDVYSVIAWVD